LRLRKQCVDAVGERRVGGRGHGAPVWPAVSPVAIIRRMADSRDFRARRGWWGVAQALGLLAGRALAPSPRAAAASDRAPDFVGVLLVLAGRARAGAGLGALGSALTPYPRPRDGAGLVKRGVYRYVRHPVYSGIVLAAFGW